MKLRLNKYSKQAHEYSVSKLKDEEIRKRYEDQIVLKIKDVPNDTEVEELWKTVKMAITESAEVVIGKKQHQEWISQEVKTLCEVRRKQTKKMLTSIR